MYGQRSDRIDQRAMPIGSLHIRARRKVEAICGIHGLDGLMTGGLWRIGTSFPLQEGSES